MLLPFECKYDGDGSHEAERAKASLAISNEASEHAEDASYDDWEAEEKEGHRKQDLWKYELECD